MPFPFTLFRALILFVIIACNVSSTVLPIIAFREQTAGSFEILAIILSILSLVIITGCLSHQFANRSEESSNTRNLGMFGSIWLLGIVALAISLTFHTRQGGAVALCNDYVDVQNTCILANVQLAMAYVSPIFASVGFVISWIDKFPGVVKVTPRYTITKAPSSHFAAHSYPLDDEMKYTPQPSKRSKDSLASRHDKWSDIPV
ncbi:hypothetical protein BU15DRAFT_66988 [Melanogaster broomeanus]|nr:hypothetical protein BU15DRAFT_66988 [Melanogaster broomeanus]